MNRIKELRELRGWSQDELGRRVGTSQVQIGRLEDGKRKLTVDWMVRIASAFGVTPGDLLSPGAQMSGADDIEPAPLSIVGGLTRALESRGLKIYRVAADSVERAGLAADQIITVDESADAIARAADGDIVVVEIDSAGRTFRVLRQFLRPSLIVTNRRGAPVVQSLDDMTVRARIVGVVVRD